jgi:hypothetical protein
MVLQYGPKTKMPICESSITGAGVPPENRIEHLLDVRLEHYYYTSPWLRQGSKLKAGLGSKLYPS